MKKWANWGLHRFWDLNKACPIDDFPVPLILMLIDATTSYEAFFFMDGCSGYNHIKIHLEDEEMTVTILFYEMFLSPQDFSMYVIQLICTKFLWDFNHLFCSCQSKVTLISHGTLAIYFVCCWLFKTTLNFA